MYTTLSPCDMCTGACLLYKISRVVIGENETFYGGEDYLRQRGVEVINLNNSECKELMTKVFPLFPPLSIQTESDLLVQFIEAKPEVW